MTDTTDAELRMLLMDCIALWGVDARVAAREDDIEITAADGAYLVRRAPPDMRPVRWLLQRPNRAPRVAPSVVALLAALRNALGAEGGNKLRIGAS
jgi:hypothetical protein